MQYSYDVAPRLEVHVNAGLSETLVAEAAGAVFPKALGGAPAVVIAKFVLETSKKMLPTAATLMRAAVVTELGTMTTSEPSFGERIRSVDAIGWLRRAGR